MQSDVYVAFWYRNDCSGIVLSSPSEAEARDKAYRWQEAMNALIESDDDVYDVVIEQIPEADAEALIALYDRESEEYFDDMQEVSRA